MLIDENNKKIEEHWDHFAETYEKIADIATLQPAITLYGMTKASQCNRVLEVAAGTGRSGRAFIASIMKKGAVYVATDISKKMIEIYENRFKASDIYECPNVKFEKLDSWSNVEAEEDKKKVVLLKANNERLPFEDESFDCYIATFSLMLVDNHKNQLAEAYRVLQPGCYAGFSVWGREEYSNQFTFFKRSLAKKGIEVQDATRSNFHLNDTDKLLSDMKDAGFKYVKLFRTAVNAPYYSADDYLVSMKPKFDGIMEDKKFRQEDREELWEFVKQDCEEQFGENSTRVIDFEAVICIGKK